MARLVVSCRVMKEVAGCEGSQSHCLQGNAVRNSRLHSKKQTWEFIYKKVNPRKTFGSHSGNMPSAILYCMGTAEL